MQNVNIVAGQHHYLPTCPCSACADKRAETSLAKLLNPPPSRRLVSIPPETARLLGFLKTNTPVN